MNLRVKRTLREKKLELDRLSTEALVELARRDKYKRMADWFKAARKSTPSLIGLIILGFAGIGLVTTLLLILGPFINPIKTH